MGGASYSYDGRGNLTSTGSRSFSYDLENHLLSVNGGAFQLGYDPLGRLRQTSAAGSTTSFLYDGDQLVAEYDGAALMRRYVHGAGVDEPLAWYEGSGTSDRRYLIGDNQGTIIAADGAAVVRNAYGPYGEPSAWTGAGGSMLSRFRYTGQIALPEAQLYHYKARVYDPVLGRFLQTDPVGYLDNSNLYGYVQSDPLNHSDPTGLCTGSLLHGAMGGCTGSAGAGPSEYALIAASLQRSQGNTGSLQQMAATIPGPPEDVEGGPWTEQPGQRPGTYQGPRQPAGPRAILRWVPPESEGGPPGSTGYWKRQLPGERGWQRFDPNGRAITPEEAHPGRPEPAPEPAPAPEPTPAPAVRPPIPFEIPWPLAPFIILPPNIQCTVAPYGCVGRQTA